MSGWNDEPSAGELRAPRVSDEQPVRHTRRRSTKQWCKGKVGVAHVPEIKLDRYTESLQLYPRQDGSESRWRRCGWRNWGWRRGEDWHYNCRHQRRCANCGSAQTTHPALLPPILPHQNSLITITPSAIPAKPPTGIQYQATTVTTPS